MGTTGGTSYPNDEGTWGRGGGEGEGEGDGVRLEVPSP